jgi:ABC-2 type transport system ATP-binding protein
MRRTDGRHVVQFAVSGEATRLCQSIATEFPGLQCHAVSDTAVRVESPEPVRIGPLVRTIEDSGAEVTEARKLRPSLEDVFVEITGIEAGAMKQEQERAKRGGGA